MVGAQTWFDFYIYINVLDLIEFGGIELDMCRPPQIFGYSGVCNLSIVKLITGNTDHYTRFIYRVATPCNKKIYYLNKKNNVFFIWIA